MPKPSKRLKDQDVKTTQSNGYQQTYLNWMAASKTRANKCKLVDDKDKHQQYNNENLAHRKMKKRPKSEKTWCMLQKVNEDN